MIVLMVMPKMKILLNHWEQPKLTESIDREIGDFVESIQAKLNLMNKLGGDK